MGSFGADTRKGTATGDVLLVFPGKLKAPDPQVPLQLLYVAAALRRSGYRTRIFDMRLDDYRAFAIGDPLFVGVTCMSGQQIRYGLEFAARVRAERPGCPIVWGGVHPTLLPEQTAASGLVDVVVRGEGELIVADLADRLAAGESPAGVNGVTCQGEGLGAAVTSTPAAGVLDLDSIPIELPYDLLQLEQVSHAAGGPLSHPDQPWLPPPLWVLLQQHLQWAPLARQERAAGGR